MDTTDERNQFQAALDQATGARTAADQAAMAASMDQHFADFERMAADATHNKENPYFGRPDLIARTRTEISAIRLRAGLAPTVAPVTPQQMAAEQHQASFSLPEQINPGLGEVMDAALADLAKNPDRRDAQAAELRKSLGPAAYSELLVSAELVLGRGKVTKELEACAPALRALHSQRRYVDAKRNSAPRG